MTLFTASRACPASVFAPGKQVCVIVNDMASLNIDASLIGRSGLLVQRQEELVQLQNGCICCTLRQVGSESCTLHMAGGTPNAPLVRPPGACSSWHTPVAQDLLEEVARLARSGNAFDYLLIESSGALPPALMMLGTRPDTWQAPEPQNDP